ncbi:MAG TPA: class C sortase [Ruminococcaceae bacterium]|nr:class C sortase [Oscillospiraceae bacterium]
MKRKIIRIAAIVILVAGLGIFLFPYITNWLYEQNAEWIITVFDDKNLKDSGGGSEPYLPELYAEMQAYNREIYSNKQADLKDAFSYQETSFDLSEWGFADNMVGYINIPQMGIKLPIYLGATTENLDKGAAHLSQTSLPIGGDNTNCVLAAHRSKVTAEMFKNIEEMQPGDEIFITNLWETLRYQVVESKIIEPDEVREIHIREGKDMVTLFTCHPQRSTRLRYVVYCERVS